MKLLLLLLLPTLLFSHWQEELKQKAELAPPAWMIEQIASDLSLIHASDLNKETLHKIMTEKSEELLLVRYQIRDRKVYEEYPSFLADHPRLKDMRKSLQELLETLSLPDLDFILSLSDSLDDADPSVPVFVFAKNVLDPKKLILIPDFEALQHSETVLKSVREGIKKYPWEKKKALAFWRGASTGTVFTVDTFLQLPRSELVALSLSFPQLIDARLTLPVTQCDDPAKVELDFADYFGKHRSIKKHLEYKYQILIDGNTCAFARAYWQLFSNSVIFKQQSPNIQWYYRALIPNVHYIPFNTIAELPSKLDWAKKHDKEAEKITKKAQKFANENLKKSDVYYYLYLLLREFSKIN